MFKIFLRDSGKTNENCTLELTCWQLAKCKDLRVTLQAFNKSDRQKIPLKNVSSIESNKNSRHSS